MPPAHRLAFALAFLGLATVPALPLPLRADEGPAAWTMLAASDSNLSPAVIATPAVVDPIRRRVLVIGSTGVEAGVWAMALDGPARWERVPSTGQPFVTLSGCAAIFDTPGDRMIVFGGVRDGGTLPDVWQLSFAGAPAWSKLATVGTAPSQRDGPSAIFDPARRRMIVFGGNAGGFQNDAWALSLGGTPAWQQLSPGGTPPAPRYHSSAVFDARRDRMLIFGGYRSLPAFPYLELFNDVWQLPLADGSAWDSLTVTGTHPTPRQNTPAVYDSLHDRMEFYGGYTNFSDTYLNDHWWLTLSGPPAWVNAGAPGPPGRLASHAAALDLENTRFLVFGGIGSLFMSRDAWSVPTAGTRVWQHISPTLPPGRPPATFATSVFLARRTLFVAPGRETYYAEGPGGLWAFDLDARTWQLIRADATRVPACLDTAGRRLLAFAPTYSFPIEHIGTLWQIPLDGGAPWTSQAIGGWLPEDRTTPDCLYDAPRHRVLIYGGTTYPIPGHSSIPRHEVLAFSLDSLRWSLVSPEMASFGYGHAVIDRVRNQLVFVAAAGGPLWGLPLDGSSDWQPLGWSVGPTPQDPYGSWPPLASTTIHEDPARDRLIVPTRGESLWVLPLGHPGGDWSPLPMAGASPHGDAWLAAFDPNADRGFAFGGSCASNGVWEVNFDEAVPTQVALAHAWASPGAVELEWRTGGGPIAARVERRDATGGWVTLGDLRSDGIGALRWRDPNVEPGRRYAYRLAWNDGERDGTTSEVWIEVPRAPALEFAGLSPNPASGEAAADFSLAATSDVVLEVFDTAGRRIASRALLGAGPGRHRVALPELEGATPGVFSVRLRAGAMTFTRRVAIVR